MIDYKRIIKSRKVRLAILRFFNFIPDKWMVKLQYRIKMGKKLNLKNPKSYNEKLQWYKLYYKNPLMVKCVDKYDVRKYVADCGCSELLNECYGVYNNADEIDFSKLPNQFVAKSTLGGGGNSVVIVKDKSKLDIPALKKQMNSWVRENAHIKNSGREWPYNSGENNRIIIEKYIESDDKLGLVDYKFFCFNGRAEYMFVIAERVLGESASLDIYDRDFNKLPYRRSGKNNISVDFEKPENFAELRDAAEKLSKQFSHARVDLYDQNGKIIFGEITFYSGSGYSTYEPEEFDYLMGEKFILPERNK